MQSPDRLHIVGAPGSGTTSPASAIATRHGHRHLDTDDGATREAIDRENARTLLPRFRRTS